jgi:hypothetical protein
VGLTAHEKRLGGLSLQLIAMRRGERIGADGAGRSRAGILDDLSCQRERKFYRQHRYFQRFVTLMPGHGGVSSALIFCSQAGGLA